MNAEKTNRKPHNFWTEEIIFDELKKIIKETKCFPSQRKLKKMNRSDLLSAIKSNNGFKYYREKLGYEIPQKERGFWNDESIISELKQIDSELNHFPSHNELKEMNRSDLSNAIINHRGVKYYREQLGYELLQKHKGYWNEATIISELKVISAEMGHFPTRKDLFATNRSDLVAAIDRQGSFIKFRIILNHKIYSEGLC